ncbi:MAG: hypothetical protein ACRCU6_12500 [Fusobacteriaceae bacterium]
MKFGQDGTGRKAANTLLPMAVWYLRTRSESTQWIIYKRDIKPLLDNGLVCEDTIRHLRHDLEALEEISMKRFVDCNDN